MTITLTERQRDVLRWLEDEEFRTPRSVGGTDGSHHSATLERLAQRGLAERKKFHAIHCPHGSTQRSKLVNNRWVDTDGHPPYEGCRCKGSCRYRRTPAGRAALGIK